MPDQIDPLELTLAGGGDYSETSQMAPAAPSAASTQPAWYDGVDDQWLCGYVRQWRDSCRTQRRTRWSIWNECWELYRGKADNRAKDNWQSKVFLPKAWAAVKQATNIIGRYLRVENKPYQFTAINPDDYVAVSRGNRKTKLTKLLMDKAGYLEEFLESLEGSFIMGIGVMKCWWDVDEIEKLELQDTPETNEVGAAMGRQIVRNKVANGELKLRAVDPYHFYWLPGSKFNKWRGTIEEIEATKYDLLLLAEKGVISKEVVDKIKTTSNVDGQSQNQMRFDDNGTTVVTPQDMGLVRLLEYYGPVVKDGKVLTNNAHLIVTEDKVCLKKSTNMYWHKKPPYIAWSPLTTPFRTDGTGLIEQVREVLRNLNRLANFSIDTLLFRLLPMFEVVPEVYENPEDFETGIVPGKIFRRNLTTPQLQGIKPIQTEDISQGTVQISAVLDRSFQEGALVTEAQQSIPRYRGAQSATETQIMQTNQDSFFGGLAANIENNAIKPLVDMCGDLILQFLVTNNDPRVAQVLGVDAQDFAGLTREDIMGMIHDEYTLEVTGLTNQLQKAEMVQNLVQFMNLLGQNPEAWMPYIDQGRLLQKILEGFRPMIDDVDKIVLDPIEAQRRQAAAQQQQQTTMMASLLPQLLAAAQAQSQAQGQADLQQQQMAQDMEIAQMQAQQRTNTNE
jgi:hypothetical protein